MTDDYEMGACSECGNQFRLLYDGTVRSHGVIFGGRCDGSRLPPDTAPRPGLDPLR